MSTEVLPVLSGTYSPWNSRNTLFNQRAFFILYLPVTVAFRWVFKRDTLSFSWMLKYHFLECWSFWTAINNQFVALEWRIYGGHTSPRSYCTWSARMSHFTPLMPYKLETRTIIWATLKASGECSPVPLECEHFNTAKAHDCSRDVYLKTEKIVEFIDNWDCVHEEISQCTVLLAEEFRWVSAWALVERSVVRRVKPLRNFYSCISVVFRNIWKNSMHFHHFSNL